MDVSKDASRDTIEELGRKLHNQEISLDEYERREAEIKSSDIRPMMLNIDDDDDEPPPINCPFWCKYAVVVFTATTALFHGFRPIAYAIGNINVKCDLYIVEWFFLWGLVWVFLSSLMLSLSNTVCHLSDDVRKKVWMWILKLSIVLMVLVIIARVMFCATDIELNFQAFVTCPLPREATCEGNLHDIFAFEIMFGCAYVFVLMATLLYLSLAMCDG